MTKAVMEPVKLISQPVSILYNAAAQITELDGTLRNSESTVCVPGIISRIPMFDWSGIIGQQKKKRNMTYIYLYLDQYEDRLVGPKTQPLPTCTATHPAELWDGVCP